jgi:NTE family protein
VFGGGGVVFVAWLTGYLGEVARRGIDLGDADRLVGTSAGALLAGVVAGGRLNRFGRLLGLLAPRPALIGRLAPADGLKASQERGRDLFEHATDAQPATIRAIGAGALAAATPSSILLPTSVLLMLQMWRWPDDRLVVSAVDAYTGELLVLTRASGVPLLRAVAASASVPGLFPPQRVLDRRCMDGGASGTGIRADLVAGAGRALLFPIAYTLSEPRLTISSDGVEREVAALRQGSSRHDRPHEWPGRVPVGVHADRYRPTPRGPSVSRLWPVAGAATGSEFAREAGLRTVRHLRGRVLATASD